MTPFSVKKENDTSLEEGTEKVIEQGRQGYTTSTYRVYYDENRNEIKREKVTTSYYPPRQKIVFVGVKREDTIDELFDTRTTNRPQGSSNSTGNRPGNSGSSNSTGNRPGNSGSSSSTDNRQGNGGTDSDTSGSEGITSPETGGDTVEQYQPEDNNVY